MRRRSPRTWRPRSAAGWSTVGSPMPGETCFSAGSTGCWRRWMRGAGGKSGRGGWWITGAAAPSPRRRWWWAIGSSPDMPGVNTACAAPSPPTTAAPGPKSGAPTRRPLRASRAARPGPARLACMAAGTPGTRPPTTPRLAWSMSAPATRVRGTVPSEARIPPSAAASPIFTRRARSRSTRALGGSPGSISRPRTTCGTTTAPTARCSPVCRRREEPSRRC